MALREITGILCDQRPPPVDTYNVVLPPTGPIVPGESYIHGSRTLQGVRNYVLLMNTGRGFKDDEGILARNHEIKCAGLALQPFQIRYPLDFERCRDGKGEGCRIEQTWEGVHTSQFRQIMTFEHIQLIVGKEIHLVIIERGIILQIALALFNFSLKPLYVDHSLLITHQVKGDEE